MKKAISLFAFVMVVALLKAQPLQHFVQRSSTSVASMSEVQNLQVFLSGSHSLVGFEGAPKSSLLNVALPIKQSAKHSQWRQSSREQTRHFVGGTLANETFGVHYNFQTTLGYAHRLWVGDRANITFGLSAGISHSGSNYDKIKNVDSEIYSKKETDFLFQFGTRFEVGKLSISAFGNDDNLSGEIVFGRLWDYTSQTSQNFHHRERQKRWHGQLSTMFTHSTESKTNLFRFSANTVYRDGLGLGVSYQTDRNLTANVSLRFTKSLRIGYAYGLLQLNSATPKHEIVVRYRLMRSDDDRFF